MSQQSSLDMVQREWLAEERISPEVNHAQTHVERGMEVVGHLSHLIAAERLLSYRSPRGAKWRQTEVFDIFGESLRIRRWFGYHGVHDELLSESASLSD
jgi:hypothetical protein